MTEFTNSDEIKEMQKKQNNQLTLILLAQKEYLKEGLFCYMKEIEASMVIKKDYTPAGKLYKIEVFAPEELKHLSSETFEDWEDVSKARLELLEQSGLKARFKVFEQADFIDDDGYCKTEIQVIEEQARVIF